MVVVTKHLVTLKLAPILTLCVGRSRERKKCEYYEIRLRESLNHTEMKGTFRLCKFFNLLFFQIKFSETLRFLLLIIKHESNPTWSVFFSRYCAEGWLWKFFCSSHHLRRIRNSIKRRKSAFCCLGSLSFLCRQTSPCDPTSLPSRLNARTYQPRTERKTLKQSFSENMKICLNETMQIQIVQMRVNEAKTSGRWKKKINFNLAVWTDKVGWDEINLMIWSH